MFTVHVAAVTDLLSYRELVRTGIARPFVVPRFCRDNQ